MPTGYTNEVMERDDMTFSEFARNSARAFGPCILMRDEPSGGFDIDKCMQLGEYHVDGLRESANSKIELEKLDEAGWSAKMEEYVSRGIAEGTSSMDELDVHAFRLNKMLSKVMKFSPPTSDHEKFSSFMVDQLTSTIEEVDRKKKYHEGQISKLKTLTVDEHKRTTMERIYWNIEYHTKNIEEIRVRNASWRKWLEATDIAINEVDED